MYARGLCVEASAAHICALTRFGWVGWGGVWVWVGFEFDFEMHIADPGGLALPPPKSHVTDSDARPGQKAPHHVDARHTSWIVASCRHVPGSKLGRGWHSGQAVQSV